MFALATLREHGEPQGCIEVAGRLYRLSDVARHTRTEGLSGSVKGVLQQWDLAWPVLRQFAAQPSGLEPIPLAGDGEWLAPVIDPGKVLCAGANYYDHLKEMGVPSEKHLQRLFFFFKPPAQAVVGPGRTVRIPPGCRKLDWEIELALVIGKRAWCLREEDALDHVAGYTVAIDMSARDLARAPDHFYKFDWVAGKAFDTSCPMGPRLVPAGFIEQPQDLRMRLWVNGELQQDASTAGMIFDIREQLATLSRTMTLEPGDVVLTGTPAGVGVPRGKFLQPGDTVTAEIDRIGRLQVQVAS